MSAEMNLQDAYAALYTEKMQTVGKLAAEREVSRNAWQTVGELSVRVADLQRENATVHLDLDIARKESLEWQQSSDHMLRRWKEADEARAAAEARIEELERELRAQRELCAVCQPAQPAQPAPAVADDEPPDTPADMAATCRAMNALSGDGFAQPAPAFTTGQFSFADVAAPAAPAAGSAPTDAEMLDYHEQACDFIESRYGNFVAGVHWAMDRAAAALARPTPSAPCRNSACCLEDGHEGSCRYTASAPVDLGPLSDVTDVDGFTPESRKHKGPSDDRI